VTLDPNTKGAVMGVRYRDTPPQPAGEIPLDHDHGDPLLQQRAQQLRQYDAGVVVQIGGNGEEIRETSPEGTVVPYHFPAKNYHNLTGQKQFQRRDVQAKRDISCRSLVLDRVWQLAGVVFGDAEGESVYRDGETLDQVNGFTRWNRVFRWTPEDLQRFNPPPQNAAPPLPPFNINSPLELFNTRLGLAAPLQSSNMDVLRVSVQIRRRLLPLILAFSSALLQKTWKERQCFRARKQHALDTFICWLFGASNAHDPQTAQFALASGDGSRLHGFPKQRFGGGMPWKSVLQEASKRGFTVMLLDESWTSAKTHCCGAFKQILYEGEMVNGEWQNRFFQHYDPTRGNYRKALRGVAKCSSCGGLVSRDHSSCVLMFEILDAIARGVPRPPYLTTATAQHNTKPYAQKRKRDPTTTQNNNPRPLSQARWRHVANPPHPNTSRYRRGYHEALRRQMAAVHVRPFPHTLPRTRRTIFFDDPTPRPDLNLLLNHTQHTATKSPFYTVDRRIREARELERTRFLSFFQLQHANQATNEQRQRKWSNYQNFRAAPQN
jgi:hypothetical protein